MNIIYNTLKMKKNLCFDAISLTLTLPNPVKWSDIMWLINFSIFVNIRI